MKNFTATMLMAGIAGGLLMSDVALGGEVTVTLSDGSSISMTEPVDVAGVDWVKSKGILPRVFLLVDEGLTSEEEKLSQLLTTARALGLLYLKRSEKVTVGVDSGDFDMFKFEEARDNALSGKMGLDAQEAVVEADAVTAWWSMLEDRGRELGLKFPRNPAPITSIMFMNAYADMIKNGDDAEIYSETVARIANSEPLLFESYLSGTTPERRMIMEACVGAPAQ